MLRYGWKNCTTIKPSPTRTVAWRRSSSLFLCAHWCNELRRIYVIWTMSQGGLVCYGRYVKRAWSADSKEVSGEAHDQGPGGCGSRCDDVDGQHIPRAGCQSARGCVAEDNQALCSEFRRPERSRVRPTNRGTRSGSGMLGAVATERQSRRLIFPSGEWISPWPYFPAHRQ